MTFLPIVDRELRVATRRRSTYRIRRWTALLATLASVCFLLYVWAAESGGRPGAVLFQVLNGYAVFLCLLAGVFITADCLSQEKREGTLGLLFLTDLKGYDVVLGKLLATSLNAFYGLLAIFPMLALPLLLGGVTGGEFWRASLSLLNTLFFSLTLGLCVSSVSRDSQRAMGATFGVLVLCGLVLPIVEELSSSAKIPAGWGYLAWVSPMLSYLNSQEAKYLPERAAFWVPLAVSNFLGWMFVATAALALPRAWQDISAEPRTTIWHGRWTRWGRSNAGFARKRARLLEVNPVLWLMSDQPALRWLVWAVVGAWTATVLAFAVFGGAMEAQLMLSFYGIRGFGFVLKALMAVQACRFFVEARRNSAMEMLLSTPITSEEILRGQWLAIQRVFLAPLLAFVAVTFLPQSVSILLTNASFPAWAPHFASFAGQLYYVLSGVADVFAVGWVGMWLALSIKKPAMALGATIVLALVMPKVIFCLPDFIIALVLIAWARTRLITDFRKMVLPQYAANWVRPARGPARNDLK